MFRLAEEDFSRRLGTTSRSIISKAVCAMTSEFSETMLELFRSEVESHSETLSNSLLQLERDPSDAGVIDSMMRAAHSIKGAARIVGVPSAVDVAHLMEDCFVAARRGELTIHPSEFDVLLTSVDLLARIAASTRRPPATREDLAGPVASCLRQLQALRGGRLSATSAAVSRPGGEDSDLPASPAPSHAPVVSSAQVLSSGPVLSVTRAPAGSTESRLTASTAEPELSDAAERVVVLTFGASLNHADAEAMRRKLLEKLKPGVRDVRFDLSATRHLDPTGLAFLAAAREYVETRTDSRLTLDPVSEEMDLVIRMSGIGRS